MPFSSGRSVRAPASKATRIVVARVPSRATRWIGSPFGAVEEVICGIGREDSGPVQWRLQGRRCGRERRCARLMSGHMATTEADIAARDELPGASSAPRPVVIEFARVTKLYPSGDTGVDDVSFTIRRGEFVFLVGSTGSGKSTLMRLLIKELDPSSGTIRVAGRSLADITRHKIPHYRRNLGVVFQDFKLLPNRTVHDNVAYALQVTGGGRKEIRAKVPDILRLTGLSTKLHNYPDQLSGGEQQRVAIARAFV